MGNINTELNINDMVRIIELERNGIVKSVWITETGVKYEVRFFDDAKAQNVYFLENEIIKKD